MWGQSPNLILKLRWEGLYGQSHTLFHHHHHHLCPLGVIFMLECSKKSISHKSSGERTRQASNFVWHGLLSVTSICTSPSQLIFHNSLWDRSHPTNKSDDDPLDRCTLHNKIWCSRFSHPHFSCSSSCLWYLNRRKIKVKPSPPKLFNSNHPPPLHSLPHKS